MSSFPTTIPANDIEIASYIRFWLGDVSTSTISDDVLLIFVDNNITKYGDTELCKITYYSTIDTLSWLIRKQKMNDGATGSAGAVTRRREKNGRQEIEVEYQDGETSTGWENVLSDLKAFPDSIGCNPFSDAEPSATCGMVVIGGADINGYEAGFRSNRSFDRAIQDNKYKIRH